MVDFQYADFYGVRDLETIVRLLRGPGGCPWDQVQTHESIRRNFLEEACEVAEAIDEKNLAHLKEELGDVLLQVVFHTSIEEDKNGLTLDQVADGVCKKLIYRHPHVFGEVTVSGTGEVLSNWEELKRREKGQDSYTDTLEAVARTLPALWRAEKVQNKAKKAGLDWPADALDKLGAAVEALRRAAAGEGDPDQALGEVLFAAVGAARRLNVDGEDALNRAADRFIARFRRAEELAGDKPLDQLDSAAWEQLWRQAGERLNSGDALSK